MKVSMVIAGVAFLVGMQASGTSVQARDQKFTQSITVEGAARLGFGDHALTFNAPVGLPGRSLAPGTYLFRRPAANVIQVANAAGDAYSQFLTIPTNRDTPSDEYAIVLGEPAVPGSPYRILAMFVPGELTGQGFVYAKR